MIHPSAIIHPNARLAPDCSVGPFCVVDSDVQLGAGCVLGPHVYLAGRVTLGARNKVHAGCVIGDFPQDLRYAGQSTEVIVGDDNVFREHVTVHRSNSSTEPTRIGSNNYFMANSHVGHNSSIGDHVIIANGALLGGHVTVHDHVFISGTCMVHQFARIGAYALMQGGSGISKDLPPYTIARGNNHISGLNVVGLRRAGFSAAERLELRQLYHLIFCSGMKLREAVEKAREQYSSSRAAVLLDFLATGRRGFCSHRGTAAQSSEAES